MRSSRILTLVAVLSIAGTSYASPSSAPVFQRGDCGVDGVIELDDAILILLHVFENEDVKCEMACDADADGRLTLNDTITLLQLMTGTRETLVGPFRECGREEAEIAEHTLDLSCNEYPPCE